MADIFVTLLVSQAPISWLKAVVPRNIKPISVTALVSQAPISWLKVVLSLNAPYILVS